jgi:hypothetical protein
MVYGMVDENLKQGGPLRGALFWQWGGNGEKAAENNHIGDDDTVFTASLALAGGVLRGACRAGQLHW